MSIPDGDMARLHTVGTAKEFDMARGSSVQHYDLGSTTPPAPCLHRTRQAVRADERIRAASSRR
ncbi:hypothetical protein [Streptomyces sp. NPDC008141]|uniref:hypothetical protein n=1 Tax=Streptomyces sp. NPDC008141 TaxID=3364815 RepID=UPI0036E54EB4